MMNPFSIKIMDEEAREYRQYFFLDDADDIVNKVYYSTFWMLKCSRFREDGDCYMRMTSLCHKLNMVKYHLARYAELEKVFFEEFSEDIKQKIREGVFLIERCQLTAEYESFLLQAKASLDVLVGFLNEVYRKGQSRNPIKRQVTFGNKGQDVIRGLENYIRHHPDDVVKIEPLLDHLRTECIESSHYEDGSINWLLTLINARDEVAHYGKSEHFAFQIESISGENKAIPPRMSPDQTMLEAFNVAYSNLLVFVQDFVALLFIPHIDETFQAFTFQEDEVKPVAPKWYLMLKAFKQFGLKSLRANPLIVLQFCNFEGAEVSMDSDTCMEMHHYYNSFWLNDAT